MRFPKRIRYRGQALATIYAKSKSYPAYRVAWQASAGWSVSRPTAKPSAGLMPSRRNWRKAPMFTALTPKQATDALAALQRLQSHFQSTGRRISLLAGISEYCEANAKLGERPLSECVDSYLCNLAAVKRKDISEAAEEFIEGRKATRIRRNDYSPD